MKVFSLESFEPPLVLPVLDGGPVVVRPFDQRDVALVTEASHDSYILSISSIQPESTVADAEAFIARQHDRATEGHGYSLVIARADTPDHGVGSIGLWLREIDGGRASIGYWVVAAARGHGVAGSALRAMVSFAFNDLSIPRLQLYIEPWNLASVRTAEQAGFHWEASLRGWQRIGDEQHDADCYSLLRDQWEAS